MKKVYFAPQTEILEYMTEEMIAASFTMDYGIGYLDPSGAESRRHKSIFDDEDEDGNW